MDEREAKLYATVKQFVEPTAEEWRIFYSCFRGRVVAKNELYLEAGQLARHLGYVSSGCLRMYYTVNGEELCKDFQSEGQFTGSLYSFLTGQPALFSVAAIEDSEVLEIRREDWFGLLDRFKVWERLGRLYLEQAFLYKEKREAAFITETASQRYAHFLKAYPAWAQRIPQKYVASYLGIKPESLSRIRAGR